MSAMQQKLSICLISFSAIADDPRVRRQGQAFHDAGWRVVAVGLGGARSPNPEWPILTAGNASLLELPAAAVLKGVNDSATVQDSLEKLSKEAVSSDVAKSTGSVRRVYRTFVPYHHRLQLYNLRHKSKVAVKEMTKKTIQRLVHGSSPTGRILGAALRASLRVLGHMRLSPLYLRQFMLRFNPEKGPGLYLEVPEVRRMYDIVRHVAADVYLANDWHTLPIAMKIAAERGAQYGYDTHEYALEEYRYRFLWRLFRQPLARSIESIGLKNALVASSVSPGIAEDMEKEYGLKQPMLVIRNTPNREIIDFRPCGSPITVLFHGLIAPDRGLEECVQSVALWRPEFVFDLRGPASPEYRRHLETLARDAGVLQRVRFLPPVPMVDLIAAASEADIGISTPPKTSKHNLYALPNKFFEYIQAGLAMCIADLPDMSRIVRRYDLGLLIPEVTPPAIAATINSFTPAAVNKYKKHSLLAAAELNWDCERQRLVEAYKIGLDLVRSQRSSNMGEINS